MSKASTGFAFVAGLTIGAAGAWYYLKDKYAKLAEEEIASVKAAYAKREKPTTEEKAGQFPKKRTDQSQNCADRLFANIKNSEPTLEAVSLVNAAKNMDKGSITEYTQRLQEAGYKDYSRTIDEKPSGTPGEVPYIISPDEFGELEDYTKVSLTYFADGVLADECGEIVDDVEEIIGDGLDHFGEYEDDSVFVRSDAKRCDYEILKDLRDFSDFKKKNFPPNNDEEV